MRKHLKYSKSEKNFFTIEGEYDENYNISFLHGIIINKIKKENNPLLDIMKKEICKLEAEIRRPQSFRERKKSLETLEELKVERKKIENDEFMKDYLMRSRPILEEFERRQRAEIIIFGVNDENNGFIDIADRNVLLKLKIIEDFFKLAKNYLDIKICRKKIKNSNQCINCYCNLGDNYKIVDNCIIVCNLCDAEYQYFSLNYFTRDDKIPLHNSDDSLDNFLKELDYFQGINVKLDKDEFDELKKKLDVYFSSNQIPSAKEVRQMKLTRNGKRGITNSKMLRNALSEIECQHYYKMVNYVGYRYWNWQLPDLSMYRDKIISNYLKTQKVFYQIPLTERERISSLGTQYRMWRELQLVCDLFTIDDFVIPENTKSFFLQNKFWKIMCEGSNDPDIAYYE